MTNLQIIRDRIQNLTYSDMMILAEWFAGSDVDRNSLDDAPYWAYLLNNFANNAEFPEDDEKGDNA